MSEFDANGVYMQKGYWGVHTPEDDCAFTRLATPTSPGIIRIVRQIWAEREPTKLATNSLNDFLRLPNRELVRTLRDGEAFIGVDYPLGTIVKFEEEHLRRSTYH